MRYFVLFALAATLTACAAAGYATDSTRQAYIDKHDPPAKTTSAILAGRVVEGMTAQEVRAALGTPDAVNTTYAQGRERLQLVYRSMVNGYDQGYVYVVDDSVTAWQDLHKIPRLGAYQ
jgi:hypothetical protein